MSNRVSLEVKDNWVRVSDDYGSNMLVLDLEPEAKLPDSDIELLQLIQNAATEQGATDILETFDFITENEKGMYIRDRWYDYDEIKGIK